MIFSPLYLRKLKKEGGEKLMPNVEGKFKALKEVKNIKACATKIQNYQKTGNYFFRVLKAINVHRLFSFVPSIFNAIYLGCLALFCVRKVIYK